MSIYGQLPPEWIEKQLIDISILITDGAHFSPRPQQVGHYMCSVKDMTYNSFNFSSVKLISEEDYHLLVKQGCSPKQGDLLISKDGANCLDILFLYNQNEEIVLLSSIAIVRLKESVSKEYIRYFLISPDCQFIMRNNYVSGSAIPRVVLKDFKKVPIVLPPLPEQKAIASALSSLDDKIDLLHRQNKTLEAMAETLFRQWFIEEAEDSWQSIKISNLFEIKDGTHDSPKQSPIGFPLVTSKHIGEGFIDFTNCYLISKSDYEKINQRSLVEQYDILFSMIGTLGKIYIESNKEINYAIKNIGLFKASQNPLWRYYVFLWLKSDLGINFVNEHKSGSTQEYISLGSLRSIEIQKPPISLLTKFNLIINNSFKKIFKNQKQIQTLENLRDTLLPKLMSGEVRVKVYDKSL